jgi:hypothetical protein
VLEAALNVCPGGTEEIRANVAETSHRNIQPGRLRPPVEFCSEHQRISAGLWMGRN